MDAEHAEVEKNEATEEVLMDEKKFMTEEERNLKEEQDMCPRLSGGRLKGYDLKGMKWMINLWQNGINWIFSHQMGYGKTLQTSGVDSHFKDKKMHGPVLIVAPL